MSNAKTAHSSELLRGKLAAVRSKQLFVALGTGVSWLVLAVAVLLAGGMLIDWKYDLTRDVRMLFLMVDVVVLVTIFLRHIYTPLSNQLDDDEVALEVEKATPEFRSRLIAATQFGVGEKTEDTAAVFVRALVKQTEEMARPKNFNNIVPVDGFARAFALTLMVAGLGVLAYNKYQPDSGALLSRAFLAQDVDVPRFTHIDKITVKPGDVIARGDDLTIEVTLKETSRVKPSTAVIAVAYASAARATPHTCTNAAGIYSLALENVRESFKVIVTANDARKTREVEVVPRPAVREIVFEQEFPTYTGLNPQSRRRGDLTLLVGSKLKIEVTANKPVASGYVNIITEGEAKTVPMTVDGKESSRMAATLPLGDMNIIGFNVKLEDKHGFKSRNEAMYRITMLPDKPPVVRVLEPVRKETKVTQRARIPIMVSVKDDYGVKELELLVQHGNSPPMPFPLQTEKATGRLQRVPFDWKIVDLKFPIGTEVKFWARAVDGNDRQRKELRAFDKDKDGRISRAEYSGLKVSFDNLDTNSDGYIYLRDFADDGENPGFSAGKMEMPGVGDSRELFALVVTDEEKRRDLNNRATDSITGVNETAINQEKLNRELGEIIRARVITSTKQDE